MTPPTFTVMRGTAVHETLSEGEVKEVLQQRPDTSPPTSTARSLNPAPSQRRKLGCQYCQRTFYKAEHLIRHERSHTKAQPFKCSVCNRRFSRQDSLSRHLKLHDRESESPLPVVAMRSRLREQQSQDIIYSSPTAGTTGTISTPTPNRLQSLGNGVDHHVSSSPSASASSSSPASDVHVLLHGPPLNSTMSRDTGGQNTLQPGSNTSICLDVGSDALASTSTSITTETMPPLRLSTSVDYPTFTFDAATSSALAAGGGGGATSFQATSLPLQPPNDDIDLWQLLSGDLLPGSTSLHASPDFLGTLGLGANLFSYRSSQTDNNNMATTFGHLDHHHHPDQLLPPLPHRQQQQQANVYHHEAAARSEQPRSQSSSSSSAQGQGSWLYSRPTAGSLSAERFHMSSDQSPISGERGQQAVSEARFLVSDLSSKVNNDVSPLSSHWLDLCLQMFWKRFIPSFPIMHQPTFNVRNTCAPLLLNMIAIGSLCLHSTDDREKGVALWRLVHKGVAGNWDKLIEIRGPYDDCKGTQLLLTAVLGQIFAMMSGNPDLSNTAVIFHGLGFRWAKMAGMCEVELWDSGNSPISHDIGSMDMDLAWSRWAARETMKRSMLAHYVLDGCLGSLFGSSPATRHLFNHFPCAADDQVFAACTPASWYDAVQESNANANTDTDAGGGRIHSSGCSLSSIYQTLFSSSSLLLLPMATMQAYSTLTSQTVLEGIYCLITEWTEGQRATISMGQVDMSNIARALVRFYQLFIIGHAHGQMPQRIELESRWHSVCIYAMRAIHNHKRMSGSGDNGNGGLSSRSSNNKNDIFSSSYGRRALLHANALRQIAARLPIAAADMPHFSLPVCMYDAAKVFLQYLASPSHDGDDGTYPTCVRLDEMTDWLALGSTGFEMDNDGNGNDTGHGLDNNNETSQWEAFVLYGGRVTVGGMELGTHELYALTTVLSVFGNVWPRSGVFAVEIQTRVL